MIESFILRSVIFPHFIRTFVQYLYLPLCCPDLYLLAVRYSVIVTFIGLPAQPTANKCETAVTAAGYTATTLKAANAVDAASVI